MRRVPLRATDKDSVLTEYDTSTISTPTISTPTSGDDHPAADERLTFDDLGVIPEIQQALAAEGITHPFPIQSLAIPIAILGTDMVGQARTGTGKTLAFGISLLQRVVVPDDEGYATLLHPGKPQALVMAPTRELAMQVARDLEVASRVRHARVLTVYGGVGYEPQLEALETGVDVVVGTPGRLLDLANRRSLDLSHVRVLVLDEADEMLDLGFLPDVEKLIAHTPSERQTMLFSATMPAAIVSLARMHLRQPINVRAEGHDAQATVPDTTQFVYQAHNLDKPEIIGKLLQASEVGKVMIFTRTKRAAQRLSDELEDRGFAATSIHGDLTQTAREKALRRFREDKVSVLVATDVAARGIDVTGVSHVVNYECPDDEKNYVHRIGRTGRAGAKGVAVTLVDWSDVTRWKVINKVLDLPFDNPPETYSTSPELLADLGIPEGTTGRVPGAERKEHHSHDGDFLEEGKHGKRQGGKHGERGDRGGRHVERAGDRGGRHTEHAGKATEATERPREERTPSTRVRRRRRNGEPVDGGSADTTTAQTPSGGTDSAESAAVGSDGPRRRRRRRTGGHGDVAGPSEG